MSTGIGDVWGTATILSIARRAPVLRRAWQTKRPARGGSRGPSARLFLHGVALWLMSAPVPQAQSPPLTNAEYDALSAAVDDVVTGATVCDVGLLPASANRPETVIGVVDFSGRLFCNTVVRVSRTRPPVLLQEISGWWVANLRPGSLEVIQDVDGDGEDELVVPTAISDYEGTGACIATLPFVYRCDDDRCVDVSAAAPDFYRRWRALLAERHHAAELSTDKTIRRTIPCLIMEIHKADRLRGRPHTPSLNVADAWTRSPDPYLRRKAVWILSDLWVENGDPAIRRRLDRLASDGYDYTGIVRWLAGRRRPTTP